MLLNHWPRGSCIAGWQELKLRSGSSSLQACKEVGGGSGAAVRQSKLSMSQKQNYLPQTSCGGMWGMPSTANSQQTKTYSGKPAISFSLLGSSGKASVTLNVLACLPTDSGRSPALHAGPPHEWAEEKLRALIPAEAPWCCTLWVHTIYYSERGQVYSWRATQKQ